MYRARNHAAVHVERFPKQLTLQPQIHPCTQTKEQVPVHTHTHTESHYQAFRGFDVGEVNQLEVGRLRYQRVR